MCRQVYSSLDLSRGHLEEKGELEEKKSESPLTVDSLSWTPDFTEMYEMYQRQHVTVRVFGFR